MQKYLASALLILQLYTTTTYIKSVNSTTEIGINEILALFFNIFFNIIPKILFLITTYYNKEYVILNGIVLGGLSLQIYIIIYVGVGVFLNNIKFKKKKFCSLFMLHNFIYFD